VKKFKFAFDKLLDHKRTLEDIARREYFEAQRLVDEAQKVLDEMYLRIDESRVRALDLATNGGEQAPALSQIDEFINLQKIRIERHRLKMRELIAEAEQRHEILIEAAKERKTLEKLRERRMEEYQLQAKLAEEKEVDELVVTRFKPIDGER
jgi:flagellar FliJ protein